MRYLLDANAAIEMLRDPASGTARRARRERVSEIALSAVTAHELYFGAFSSRRVVHHLGLVDALPFPVLEFDKEDSRVAGEVRAFLRARGMPIGPYDVLLAGQAKARELILVTHNTREFARVPGLRIEDWQS